MATINSVISLTDNMSSKLTTIKGNVDGIVTSMESVQTKADGVSWNTFIKNAEEAGKKMTKIGNKMTLAISAPLFLLGKKMYNLATDYETATTGVQKTANTTAEETAAIRSDLLALSENTPAGYVDLAGITQMAAQTGVAKDNLVEFARVYDMLQTSTDIQGEAGVSDLAHFMNITEGGVNNVSRIGGVIVDLGNKFATTENQILTMGTRMASAGELTGFTSWEIMGLSTALNAVGINAEAGGSAAGKMMKQMQLAAEVGTKAKSLFETDYGSAIDFSHYISSKENLLGIASDLGVTTEYVQSLSDSWLGLEQFASVSGKTAEQFTKDWGKNPSQGLFDFFDGLAALDSSGQESAIAKLEEMGITEIRLSNMVQAMAGNSQILKDALAVAYAAYMSDPATNPLATEFGLFAGTQESQNAMLGNKLENSLSGLGENLVSAVQPALDKVNELLDAFNGLSEADQDAVISAFLIFAAAGPICTAIGGTITAVSKIGEGISFLIANIPSWGAKIGAFFTNPSVWPIAAGALGVAAIFTIMGYLDAMAQDCTSINEALASVKINIDQDSVDKALQLIAEVQAAADKLSGKELTEAYAGTSLAVKAGYGTEGMFGQAIAYEKIMFEQNIADLATDYQGQLNSLQEQITTAVRNNDTVKADDLFVQMGAVQVEWDNQVQSAKTEYGKALNDLIMGMVSQSDGAKEKLEAINEKYNFMSYLFGLSNGQVAKTPENMDYAFSQMDAYNMFPWGSTYRNLVGLTDYRSMGVKEKWDYAGYAKKLYEEIATEIPGIIGDSGIMDALAIAFQGNAFDSADPTAYENGLMGLFQSLNVKNIADSGTNNLSDIGLQVCNGLAQGMTDNQGVATESASAMGAAVISTLAIALGVNSPSVLTMAQGQFLDDGLALGITNGTAGVVAAVTGMGASVIAAVVTVCNQAVAMAAFIMSFGVGSGIGRNLSAGFAAGILAGKGAAVAAARSVAAAAAAAMRVSLKIHSPSKVTEGYGQYYTEGFANGILGDIGDVEHAVATVSEASKVALQDNIWSLIGDYNGLEFASMQDPDNTEIKISETDLKKVRQLAEREIINQYTTAELKVEYTNNNNINSNLDVDDLFDQFGDRLAERIEFVAGGVYQ